MTEEFQLRPISASAVPNAIAKAEQYRRLNQGEEAESICRDILRVEPENRDAIIILALALTDQFDQGTASGGSLEARDIVEKLTDPYDRTYYGGIVRERMARVMLGGKTSVFAYEGLREAMDWYEKAHALRPQGDDDATLRWNSCVRAIRSHRLRPMPDAGELPLE